MMYSAIQARVALRTSLRSTVASASSAARYSSTRHFSSTVHENDPELLDQEKKRNLSKSQHKTSTPHKYAPGWNEYLASASEANVKADKSPSSPQELQSETINYIKARHYDPEGTETNTVAYYSHDTVSGPLSGAEGKEEVLVHEGKVLDNEQIPDATKLEHEMRPTQSEEEVKADRRDI